MCAQNGQMGLWSILSDTDTDRNMYLFPSSCHPPTSTKNIPFSLGLRIVIICAKPQNRENQFSKLKELLHSRGYSNRMIEAALDRARGIPRNKALRKVMRKEEDKSPVFALTYDPCHPQIQPTMAKHWRAMIGKDPYLSEVFKQPPPTAFKRQMNIRDHLIRTRVPKDTKPHLLREKRGMTVQQELYSMPICERSKVHEN